MIYLVQFFCHYFLTNHFIFYVNHLALLYSINWLIVLDQVARWMLLLQKCDFKFFYKSRHQNVIVDHLYWITTREIATNIEDTFSNTSLFIIQVN